MNKKVVMTKGNSRIFVEISTLDREGHHTTDPRDTVFFRVELGGFCGLHDHLDSGSAADEFFHRIGYLVSEGYAAELEKKSAGRTEAQPAL